MTLPDDLLPVIDAADAAVERRDPVDARTLAEAGAIIEQVRTGGADALRALAERFGDIRPGDPLVIERPTLVLALDALDRAQRAALERAAARIEDFARAQRAALADISIPIPGGAIGHEASPVERAGCYAPGGRFPLPSSALMTAVTARVAGVREVWLASPRPTPATLAAAAIAGADALLAVGGAQAIAALAYGAGPVPACDAVVGPGNRWVTGAKQLVAGRVAIDMLAGPSELLIIADDSADPALIAADLLAQAEHDDDAAPMLVVTSADLVRAVRDEVARRVETLPTRATALAALRNGFCALARDIDEAVALADRVAPEHVEVLTRDAPGVAGRLRHYGAAFVGPGAAEVVGDYGVGPNHTLPTGGSARSFAGLSVFTFLRVRTWVCADAPRLEAALYRDAAAIARLEGLEAHARSAEARL
ncbi:MAG: histidinol dehydrogenase [Phycisphaerales bacterium]|nr:MAG: histidinol dehydrogenase [Phycisphaerales bacterium]